jgi:ribose transport system ATP-binding protein
MNDPRFAPPTGAGPTVGPAVVLEVQGLTKAYPGVKALDNCDLHVRQGEIHALLGQNGAGKSTLIKLVSGVEQPDSGAIRLNGQRVAFHTPQEAQRAGIFTIFQELSLVPGLSVAENIFISDMPTNRFGKVRWRDLRNEAVRAVEWLGFAVDVDSPVQALSVAQKQGVELAKALHRNAKVVLLDEPSATLPQPDVARLFEILRALRSRGLALIYISHRLEEVQELCDAATVLRNGRKIGTFGIGDTKATDLVRAMIGRDLKFSRVGEAIGSEKKPRLGSGGSDKVVLRVRGIDDGSAVREVSFDLHYGEILGITGLVGNGQSELAACIFGARTRVKGDIAVDGVPVSIHSPADAIRAGIGYLPDERKTEGLVLPMSVASNITMASHRAFSRLTVVDQGKERRVTSGMIDKLKINVGGAEFEHPVEVLSGGNQQKVVLAKWLVSNCKILLFSEPTRGVDIAAKEEIYELIKRFVKDGGSVVVVSSELPEALMCDRVLVMSRSRLVGNLDYTEIDPHGEAILRLYTGEHRRDTLI